MLTAPIFNIQGFSTQDGPGVRTTVFFKGCNLRCAWCHNPESFLPRSEIGFYCERCTGCGRCVEACKNGAQMISDNARRFNKTACVACGACADVCYAGALQHIGKAMTPAQVAARVLADRAYYGKDGGVTASGGECMLQPDFLCELFTICHDNNISTAVDTAGDVEFTTFEQVMPLTDMFLYDIKAMDSQLHRELTGRSNTRILENYRKLITARARVIVRIPCIKGGNFYDMANAVTLLSEYTPEAVELLPYHRLGEGKSVALALERHHFETPSNDEMSELSAIFTAHDIPVRFNQI